MKENVQLVCIITDADYDCGGLLYYNISIMFPDVSITSTNISMMIPIALLSIMGLAI